MCDASIARAIGCVSGFAAGEGEGEGAREQELGDDVLHTCQFCGKYDTSFTDEKLDMHYWQECAMLMSCNECGQVRARRSSQCSGYSTVGMLSAFY